MLRRTLYVTFVCLWAVVSLVNVASASQAGTGETPVILDDCKDLADYQATMPVYAEPVQELAVVDPSVTDATSVTLNDCRELSDYQATLPHYPVPDQEMAAASPAQVSINDCLDLANYQATLPHYP